VKRIARRAYADEHVHREQRNAKGTEDKAEIVHLRSGAATRDPVVLPRIPKRQPPYSAADHQNGVEATELLLLPRPLFLRSSSWRRPLALNASVPQIVPTTISGLPSFSCGP